MPAYNFHDLTGLPFDRLTVIQRGPDSEGTRARSRWICQCECGNMCLILGESLQSRATRSCGCLRNERARDRHLTHGMKGTPEYRIWHGMRNRCLNPRNQQYAKYGGRGIHIEWTSLCDFVRDMGPQPGPEYTIERVNNDGPYSKDNCIWATRKVQARNTRRTKRLTFQGRTQSLSAWAEELHISPHAIAGRLRRGWNGERALTTPVMDTGRWKTKHQKAS